MSTVKLFNRTLYLHFYFWITVFLCIKTWTFIQYILTSPILKFAQQYLRKSWTKDECFHSSDSFFNSSLCFWFVAVAVHLANKSCIAAPSAGYRVFLPVGWCWEATCIAANVLGWINPEGYLFYSSSNQSPMVLNSVLAGELFSFTTVLICTKLNKTHDDFILLDMYMYMFIYMYMSMSTHRHLLALLFSCVCVISELLSCCSLESKTMNVFKSITLIPTVESLTKTLLVTTQGHVAPEQI